MSDELRDQYREFKTSVVQELDQQSQRITEVADDLRRRIQTAETTTVNEIRQASVRADTQLKRFREDINDRFDRLERLIEGRS